MRFEEPVSIEYIASLIDAEIVGSNNASAFGINEIHKVEEGDITFVDFEKYYQKCLSSNASFIIIDKKIEDTNGKILLVHPHPFDAYVSLVKKFKPFEKSFQMISPSAEIHPSVHLQPGVFIGNNVKIGEGSIVHSNVSIYDGCEIADHVIIHAGAIIGADAFYYKKKTTPTEFYDKLESVGKVILKSYVEIGAGTTIDRGVSGNTVIGKGTKIDNQVHIGHGVEIGENCLIAAQVGIGGKAIIEDNVILWGQVGVSKDLRIGKGAVVYAQSGVPSSIEGGKVYFGSPVDEARQKMKEISWLKSKIKESK